MEVGACVWGVGEGGHLLSACVGECCERRVEGVGVEEVLLFPSAGKQCPRRVFYGSCWTLISFVPHLSSAAAALSPQKRAPPPPLLPPKKATHHALWPHRCPQQASQYPPRTTV